MCTPYTERRTIMFGTSTGGATGTAWEEKRENIDALRSVKKKKKKRPVVERKNVFPQHVSHWMDA